MLSDVLDQIPHNRDATGNVIVYLLVGSDDTVRYVGGTTTKPNIRMRYHRKELEGKLGSWKQRDPDFRMVVVDAGDSGEIEREWISCVKKLGRVYNRLPGGEGLPDASGAIVPMPLLERRERKKRKPRKERKGLCEAARVALRLASPAITDKPLRERKKRRKKRKDPANPGVAEAAAAPVAQGIRSLYGIKTQKKEARRAERAKKEARVSGSKRPSAPAPEVYLARPKSKMSPFRAPLSSVTGVVA